MSGANGRSYLWPLLALCLAALVFLGLIGGLLRPYFSKDTMPLLGAILAGVASVVVLAVGRFAELLREDALRRERVRDLLIALHAEIAASDFSADQQAEAGAEEYVEGLISGVAAQGLADNPAATPAIPGSIVSDRDWRAKLLSAVVADRRDAVPIPFAIPDDSNFVFDALRKEFSLLPQPVIHSVIVYYKLFMQTNAYVRALSDPIFRSLTPMRRERVIRDLMELNRLQSLEGDKALADIEAYARRQGMILPPSADMKKRLRDNRTKPGRPTVAKKNGPISDQRADGSSHV